MGFTSGEPHRRSQSTVATEHCRGKSQGATVRVLLDGFFDDDALRSNRVAVEYLNLLAANEGLDLQTRIGNPTSGSIHMKLVLVHVSGETWSAVGSLCYAFAARR